MEFSSLSLGSSNQTGQFKIFWAAFVLTHLPFSSSYIKANVNYPLLLSISPSSIIQNVIEKQYLNPVLTEIQAPSFPQGRHNWIPPEATDVKCRARGKADWALLLSVFCVFPFLPFFFREPTTKVRQCINLRTIPWGGLEVGEKSVTTKRNHWIKANCIIWFIQHRHFQKNCVLKLKSQTEGLTVWGQTVLYAVQMVKPLEANLKFVILDAINKISCDNPMTCITGTWNERQWPNILWHHKSSLRKFTMQ